MALQQFVEPSGWQSMKYTKSHEIIRCYSMSAYL